MIDYKITYVVDNVQPVYFSESCFYKSVHKPHHAVLVENVLTNLANSIVLDQIDRIGSVGFVSTLIESVRSNEWQCLKIKLACTKQSRF